MALTADSGIVVMDWGRRRLVKYTTNGELMYDRPLEGGIHQHGPMGKLLSLPDGRILDFWLTDFVRGWYVPDEVFDSLPLIAILDDSGKLLLGGFGTPLAPSSRKALTLRTLLQFGDIAVVADSLLVLRNITGTIEWYPLATAQRQPSRSVTLLKYRRVPEPSEEGVRVDETGMLVGRTRLTYDYVTQAFGVDKTGRLYVVARLNGGGEDTTWPEEALVIYDRNGRRVDHYRLETRNTRSVFLTEFGTIVTLAHPDSNPRSEHAINIYEPVFPSRGSARCSWEIM